MSDYKPAVIEPKWQQYWEENETFHVEADPSKEKFYVLDMFPYPSGSGLHVGHVEGYTATDIVARFKRARGYNVLHPMGWDAFGLPAEQYAIQTGTHPSTTTAENVAVFKKQLKRLGFSYDWGREINTTDPDYFKWTQWIFLKLYERGLAYVAEVPVNWCPALGTVLANEEVIDGRSERGGFPVVRKPMRQWMLKITAYADRLIEDLSLLDWPESLIEMQRNWIGRSKGAEVDFALDEESAGQSGNIRVYTTRPDTLFGATYMVLSPEHELVDAVTSDAQRDAVTAYQEAAAKKSDLQRTDLAKDKTGVFTGAYAINPVNDQKVPIWIADYVLASYGTGAIMAVPAHDERDWEFAKKFDLPIVEVVAGGNVQEAAYTGDGKLVNSGIINDLNVPDAKEKITGWLQEQGKGTAAINYKLRDWLFSRQRYWGEPFPIVWNEDGEHQALPEEKLPLRLPELEDFQPTGTGEPPLAKATEWLHTTDEAGNRVRRETNTMPQWAGSSWYYLRYLDPHNSEQGWAPQKEQYWMPVDLYVGGQEHAVLHLLYARFWHKVLYDCGVVSTKEPFQRIVNQGMILGVAYEYFETADGEQVAASEKDNFTDLLPRTVHADDVVFRDDKAYHPETDLELNAVVEKMAKSRGNVVNPDDVIAEFGADTLRMYEMFMGPLEQMKPWNPRSVGGVFRFLARVWRLICSDDGLSDGVKDIEPSNDVLKELHRTIKKVSEDTDALRFNTAIAAMMEFTNFLYKEDAVPRAILDDFIRLLGPYAPHFAEEVWERLGNAPTIVDAGWPEWNEKYLVVDTVEIGVQVMGKVRGTIEVAPDASEDEAVAAAHAVESIEKHLEGKQIRRVIWVPGKILNFVVG